MVLESPPVISIIIPSYNKANYLQCTIRSVLSQTLREWELIIVDDNSTDDSPDLIKALSATDHRIKFVLNQVNKGANYCRNIGIYKANGKFLMFLDADDLLAPDCVAHRVQIMNTRNLDFCVFSMGIFNKNPGDLKHDWVPKTSDPLCGFLRHSLPWSILQPIWKKTFVKEIGGFDESFLRLQDVELHTKALLVEGVRFEQILSQPDCYYRVDNDRINFSNFELFNKYVQSAVQYYRKFYDSAEKKNIQQKLLGTIYRIYVRILHGYKIKEINYIQLKELEKQLLSPSFVSTLTNEKRYCFAIAKFFAKLPFRIPGINWTISRIVEY